MDYKEKYKQALEIARVVNPGTKDYNIVTTIFPELKESEDERIRKAIKEAVEYYWSDDTQARTDISAWLEKQDEYKSSDEVLKIRQEVYQSGYNDGYKHGCEDTKKQGEQKPVDFSDLRTWKYIVDAVLTEKEGTGQYLDSLFTEEVAKKLQKRFGNIEQNPTEWSDRDWYYYKKLESFLEVKDHYSPTESSSGYQKDVHETLTWLKSLKDRVRLQSIWSEDEDIIKDIIAVLSGCKERDSKDISKSDLVECYEKGISWLESLKERHTWKPGYEQMKQLGWVAEQNKDNMIGKELMSLYQDLKKLKGE